MKELWILATVHISDQIQEILYLFCMPYEMLTRRTQLIPLDPVVRSCRDTLPSYASDIQALQLIDESWFGGTAFHRLETLSSSCNGH